MAGEQTQAFIAQQRSAGKSDLQIFVSMMDNPKFAPSIQKMNSQGVDNRKIAVGLGLNIATPEQQQANDQKVMRDTVRGQAKDAGKTKAWESALLGFSDLGAGVIQGALYAKDAVTGGNSYDKFTNQRKDIEKFHEARREANDQGFDGWRLAGNVAGTPLVGKGFQGAKILSQAGAKVLAQNAGVGAMIGGSGFAENADERLKNTAMGGVGGAGGAVIGKKIGDGITWGYNAFKNNLGGTAREVLDQGVKHGVRVSAGDAGQGAITRRNESLLEQVPVVGMSGFRKTQHEEAKAAANKIVESLRQKMTEVDYKSLDKIQKAAGNGDKNAIRIMGVVNGAGDDSSKVLQAAAEIKNWRGQQVASQMYDRVGKLAGNSTVAPNKTIRVIDDVIASDSKVVPNKELLGEISNIKSKLSDPNIDTNFREMRAARSRLGELIDEWGRQGKSTSALTKIRTAIDDDIRAFANNSGKPALVAEYKRADAFYKNLQTSKDKTLANAMSSNKPDEIFDTFIKVGKGDRAANFYQNLDPKGQAALRYEMANRALNKATNDSKDTFSPAKFALEFERMGEPYGKIFTGADKAQMDGFVKLMRHVERAGQYAENPPTGNRLVGMAIGGTAVANAPLAIKVASVSAMAKILFTTNAGKRILLASKELPPNSPKFANLLKMAQQLSTVGGANAANE